MRRRLPPATRLDNASAFAFSTTRARVRVLCARAIYAGRRQPRRADRLLTPGPKFKRYATLAFARNCRIFWRIAPTMFDDAGAGGTTFHKLWRASGGDAVLRSFVVAACGTSSII